MGDTSMRRLVGRARALAEYSRLRGGRERHDELGNPATGGQTKYEVTRDALRASLGDLPANISVGLTFYPNMNNGGAIEQARDLSPCIDESDDVPIAMLGPAGSAHREALESALNRVEPDPNGATPTHDAFNIARDMLKHVALRSDPSALALRGIAMAQLGELSHAKVLLRRAAHKFGTDSPVARARCVVARAEVALALRDLAGANLGLDEAVAFLTRRGDLANAAFARLVQVRRLTLLGEVERAERVLGKLSVSGAPPLLSALFNLAVADLSMKRVDSARAEQSLRLAREAVSQARIAPLMGELETAEKQLRMPVARAVEGKQKRPLLLRELPEVWASGQLVIDACRREVRLGSNVVSLVIRPILLELLTALGEATPGGAARDALITRVFGAKRVNDSHRVRLRVEVGRLRKLLPRLAEVHATSSGYELTPRGGVGCCVLLPPTDGEASALLALLRGGDAWATSALAAALGKSQRAVLFE